MRMPDEKQTDCAAPGPLEMKGAKDSIGFMLSKVGNAVSERFASIVGEYGLVPRQFFVLNLISEHQGESQQAIAESVGVAKSQMVAVVDELEEKGMLERRANPDDRRQHALYVTKRGMELRDKARGAAQQHERWIRAQISSDEAKVVLAALQKLAIAEGTPLGVHGTLAKKLADN